MVGDGILFCRYAPAILPSLRLTYERVSTVTPIVAPLILEDPVTGIAIFGSKMKTDDKKAVVHGLVGGAADTVSAHYSADITFQAISVDADGSRSAGRHIERHEFLVLVGTVTSTLANDVTGARGRCILIARDGWLAPIRVASPTYVQ